MEFAISSNDLAKAGRPMVTIAMATYNSAGFVRAALASALRQTVSSIEVIVVDDGSIDETLAIVEELARADPRIRVERTDRNGGPGAARNCALDLAQGEWFAILDSDDLFAADRIARLIAAANESGAQIIADNLILFDDGNPESASFFLPCGQVDRWLTLQHYLSETRMFERNANYGFLKPMIKLDALRTAGLRYDAGLRIGEDDDLVTRMLLAGLRYRLTASPGYAYRKHGASISHRLPVASADAMVAASGRIVRSTGEASPVAAALRARHRAFQRAAGFTAMVDALKQRQAGRALSLALRQPASLPLLRMPLGAAWRRLTRRAQSPAVSVSDPQARIALETLLADLGTPS